MKKSFTLLFIMLFSLAGIAQENLFISEYVEGSGNNKGIEIYNNSDTEVDMSDYWVLRYSNGSSDYIDGGFTQLSGSLAPEDTYVFVNGQTEDNDFSPAADTELQDMADKLDGSYPAPMYMNGNDAIALVYSTDELSSVTPVDLFGKTGQQEMAEASGWAPFTDTTITYNYYTDNDTIEVGATITDYVVPKTDDEGIANFGPYWVAWSKDHTLIRKPDVTQGYKGNPDVFDVTEQWDTLSAVYDEEESDWVYQDIWSNLGQHTITTTSARDFSKLSKDYLSVYPNPVSHGTFTVSSPYKQQIISVEIRSLLGRKVYSKTGINAPRTRLQPDIRGNQIYLLKVTFADQKFLVTKLLFK